MADALVLATRKSPLALRQAEMARDHLQRALPGAEIALLPLSTKGDERLDWSLTATGGKGLFTKELEDALLDGRAHLAVHSSKDVPTVLPEDLTLAGFLPRDDPRDVLVLREGIDQPLTLATSSPRRQKQLHGRFPEATWTEIRGNVSTRLEKIARGEADGTVLARAGLDRLGISGHPGLVFETLAPWQMVPAPAQGAIALECRANRRHEFEALLDIATASAATLERELLRLWEGGCKTAFGACLRGDVLYVYHENHGTHALSQADLTGGDPLAQARQAHERIKQA